MVCNIGSNRPLEIEYWFLSKETHPTKIVVVFWTLVYEPQSVQKPSMSTGQPWIKIGQKNINFTM